jgi:hypothetical protein
MILNDPTGKPATPGIGTCTTIDDLFAGPRSDGRTTLH